MLTALPFWQFLKNLAILDNFNFFEFFFNVWQLLIILVILTALTIIDHFFYIFEEKRLQFLHFWKILKFFNNIYDFDIFKNCLRQFWQFWHLWTMLTIFDNLYNFSIFFDKFDTSYKFWLILAMTMIILVAFETLITILVIDIMNPWQYFVTWHLRVKLDSIRNSCDVFCLFSIQLS